jgi:hypothetical protein
MMNSLVSSIRLIKNKGGVLSQLLLWLTVAVNIGVKKNQNLIHDRSTCPFYPHFLEYLEGDHYLKQWEWELHPRNGEK